jgi:phosphoribosyl 1,2-cyclic phosphodiesterase
MNALAPIRDASEPRHRLDVTSLGSGSSGNALLVRTAETTLLVDCGVGVRRLTQTLAAHGLRLSEVNAILVSHEHSDHIRELPRFAALGTPVLGTSGTASALPVQSEGHLTPGRPLQIADVEVSVFGVSHDAREPCGFLLRAAGSAIAVMTDLGCASGAAAEAIAEADLVVIEANHDEEMVRRGPYPRHLQRRILSDSGHLSNADCADLLAMALQPASRLPTVWLAHLSETNNRPLVALRTVERRLARAGLHLDMQALPRREAGATWRPSERKQAHAQLLLDL